MGAESFTPSSSVSWCHILLLLKQLKLKHVKTIPWVSLGKCFWRVSWPIRWKLTSRWNWVKLWIHSVSFAWHGAGFHRFGLGSGKAQWSGFAVGLPRWSLWRPWWQDVAITTWNRTVCRLPSLNVGNQMISNDYSATYFILFTSLRDGNRPHRIVGQPLVTANDVGHWDQKHPKVLIVGKKNAKNLIAMYSGPTQFKK